MFDKRLLARFGRDAEAAKAVLTRELADFGALPEPLTEIWFVPLSPGHWSPAQLTEHVLKVNTGMSKVLYLLRQEGSLPPEARTPGVLVRGNAQAPAFSRPGEPLPWTALEPTWLEMQTRFLAETEGTRDWTERTRFHPYFGDLNALGWVQAAALHMAHHRRQLEPLAGSEQAS